MSTTPLRPHGWLLAAILLGLLLAAPRFLDPYQLSVLTLALWFAYVGQAWNLMMGFAGQLSLGHALYVGLGGYAAAALYVHFGVGPWFGMLLAVAVAAVVGAVIGALGFRFGVRGVYFALLTIAFAEFTRIAFDHWDWLGGSGGLFLPVVHEASNDLWTLRGEPALYYYVMLAMTVLALLLVSVLLRSRLGYYWLAVREDQDAAAAAGVNVFRTKLSAVVLSGAMTAPGGVIFAFMHNNLFPEEIFSMARSIEIIIPPIVGGLGTLFGPIVGAFILTPFGEAVSLALDQAGLSLPGLKQFLYGLALMVIIIWMPHGIWPWLARRLGLFGRPGHGGGGEKAP